MLINRREALALSAGALLATTNLARGQGRKTLRMAPHAALRVLDPVVTNAYITRNHAYMVYDTLFSVDSQYRPQPQMVKDWSVSADKLAYTFTLREKLAFHDGQPVTAEDCIASIARWAKKDVVGLRLAAVTTGMQAVDARSFRIDLKEPFGPMLEAFARPSSIPLFIMPRRIAELPADKVLEEVVGSGPFKFVASEFRPGVSWAYERNEAYVPRDEAPDGLAGGKQVKVDRVEVIWFPSKQTAINALAKGEIDLLENMNADQRSQLQANKDVVIRRRPGPNASTVRFNWAQPPFDNVKVRQAVQAVVTQQDYMDASIGDPESYQVCPAFFGCGTPLETAVGFADTGKPDIAKAKALLKEAGYKGEKIVIITPGDIASFAPLAPLTQQLLRQIGMDSEIQTMEWSAFLTRRSKPVPVTEGGWNLAHAVFDRIDLISPLGNLNFDARGKAAYTGFVDDPQTEALKGRYQRETDPARQKAIVEEMQKRAYELVFYIPLGTYFDYETFRSTVSGYVPSPVMVVWGVDKR
ncbi:Extracellular solute-binding protein family 5 precursor [Bosea sp. LC85]|uniref:ABC transporter substrate-binding protein n=1 Tax=Bosea sp. LC85 TaxID=1502851 RepID=UPI0004E32C55|nr:ABC transporter substrate-binding protein [Bosea sp. LC85]KFC65313.1 Extracellular solute-binding protein family 5 precursor [Bosea sp. LC85]